MDKEFESVNLYVGNQRLRSNMYAYQSGGEGEGVLFFSAFGICSDVKNVASLMRRRTNVNIRRYEFQVMAKQYEVLTAKVPNSDYSHIIAYKKDYSDTLGNGEEWIHSFLYIQQKEQLPENGWLSAMQQSVVTGKYKYPQILIDKVYDKLYQYSPVPMIKDWASAVISRMIMNNNLKEATSWAMDEDTYNFHCYIIDITETQLVNYIKEALACKEIVVSETANSVSNNMLEADGIDSYLNSFSEKLAEKIQTSFTPRFTPGKDTYSQKLKDMCDYASYMGHVDLYGAQKDSIQAASNALDHEKATFIVGECGVGKTLLAIETILTNNKKKTMTNIIMCPGKLVNKWKREILRVTPRARVEIINSFSELRAIEPEIRNKNKLKSLWLVMSKDAVKFGFDKRPAAVWKHTKSFPEGVYCCPECGQELYSEHWEGTGRMRVKVKDYFTSPTSFSKELVSNAHCMNTVPVINKETGEKTYVDCNSDLWAPNTHRSEDEFKGASSDWVKLGKNTGWIERRFIQSTFEDITSQDKPEKKFASMIPELADAIAGNIPPQRAPKKYPISRYIRQKFTGLIDYLVTDEIKLGLAIQ